LVVVKGKPIVILNNICQICVVLVVVRALTTLAEGNVINTAIDG